MGLLLKMITRPVQTGSRMVDKIADVDGGVAVVVAPVKAPRLSRVLLSELVRSITEAPAADSRSASTASRCSEVVMTSIKGCSGASTA
jgi:hypothetical protein